MISSSVNCASVLVVQLSRGLQPASSTELLQAISHCSPVPEHSSRIYLRRGSGRWALAARLRFTRWQGAVPGLPGGRHSEVVTVARASPGPIRRIEPQAGSRRDPQPPFGRAPSLPVPHDQRHKSGPALWRAEPAASRRSFLGPRLGAAARATRSGLHLGPRGFRPPGQVYDSDSAGLPGPAQEGEFATCAGRDPRNTMLYSSII